MSGTDDDVLERYLAGSLDDAEGRRCEQSLRDDGDMRRRLLALAAFEEALPAALREANRAARERRRLLVRLAWAAAAAAVLGLGGLWTVRARRPAPPSAAVEIANAPAPALPPDAPLDVPGVPPAPTSVGRIASVRGELRIERPGNGVREAVREGTVVCPGDVLALAPDAHAEWVHQDGSRFRLHPHTRLEVGDGDGKRLVLLQGGLDAALTAQPAGAPWRLSHARVEIEVLGTELRLMDDAGSAWLGVREGRVWVERRQDGRRVRLGRGQYAADHPQWPFQAMDARVCPMWKSICRRVAGSEYP